MSNFQPPKFTVLRDTIHFDEDVFVVKGEGVVENLTLKFCVRGMPVTARSSAPKEHDKAVTLCDGHMMQVYSDSGHVRWGHACELGKCGRYAVTDFNG